MGKQDPVIPNIWTETAEQLYEKLDANVVKDHNDYFGHFLPNDLISRINADFAMYLGYSTF